MTTQETSDARRRALALQLFEDYVPRAPRLSNDAPSISMAVYEGRLMLEAALDSSALSNTLPRYDMFAAPRRKAKTSVLEVIAAADLLTFPGVRVHYVACGMRAAKRFLENVQRLVDRHNADSDVEDAQLALANGSLLSVHASNVREPALPNFPSGDIVLVDDLTMIDATTRAHLMSRRPEVAMVLHSTLAEILDKYPDARVYKHVSLVKSAEERVEAARAAGIAC